MKINFKTSKIVLISVLLCGGIALLHSFLSPAVYKATLQISIDTGNAASPLTKNFESWQSYIKEQTKVMKSNDLLEKVIERLHLRLSKKFAVREPVAILQKVIRLNNIRGTNLINITTYMDNAELASKITNTLAALYISQTEENKFELTKEAIAWLKGANEISKRIADAREAQQKFIKENNLELLKEELEAANDQLTKLTKEKEQKDTQSKELESRLKEINAFLGGGDKENLFFLLKNNLNLLELKNAKEQINLKISNLKSVYEESHPEIIKLRKELEQVDRGRDEIVDNILKNSNAELAAIKKHTVYLDKEISDTESKVSLLNEKAVKFDDFSRKVEIEQKFYNEFLDRLKDGQFSFVQVTNLGLLSQQEAMAAPVGPRKTRNILLGILMGLILGNIISYVMQRKKSAS